MDAADSTGASPPTSGGRNLARLGPGARKKVAASLTALASSSNSAAEMPPDKLVSVNKGYVITM